MKSEIKTLAEARQLYYSSEITFLQLDAAFHRLATDDEKLEFWNAPVFDRAAVVEGKSKEERDAKWDVFVKAVDRFEQAARTFSSALAGLKFDDGGIVSTKPDGEFEMPNRFKK